MWRTAFIIFITLTTTMSSMLFWQWRAFSQQNNPMDKNGESIIQEIIVLSEQESLHITQNIRELTPGKTYRFTIPNDAYDWTCQIEEEKACPTDKEDPNTFVPETTESQFTFRLPIPTSQASFLLNDWTTKISGVYSARTELEIVDSERREGTWVTGMPLRGFKEKDIIDYYYFTSIGDASSLYWQQSPLQHVKLSNGLEAYSADPNAVQKNQWSELTELPDFPYLSLVMTNQFKGESGKGILLSPPTAQGDELKRSITEAYVKTSYGLSQQWLVDLFTSYMAELEPGTEKGKALLAQLSKKLTEEEMERFFQLAIDKSNGTTTTKKLDRELSEVKGARTKFFTLNEQNEQNWTPLYFIDPRRITINEKPHKDLEAVVENGKAFYPFVETLTSLGFIVEYLQDQDTILLTREQNLYRFYMDSNLFIYNEEDYGLLESPLKELNGKHYITKQWLQTLFKITFTENEESIDLSL